MKRKNPMRLNDRDALKVIDMVEREGLDYTFRYYTNFPEIKDKKFQKLRKAYVKAAQDLSDYCRLEESLVDDKDFEDAATCAECGDDLDAGGLCHTCDQEL
jgi:hypothetical protein